MRCVYCNPVYGDGIGLVAMNLDPMAEECPFRCVLCGQVQPDCWLEPTFKSNEGLPRDEKANGTIIEMPPSDPVIRRCPTSESEFGPGSKYEKKDNAVNPIEALAVVAIFSIFFIVIASAAVVIGAAS